MRIGTFGRGWRLLPLLPLLPLVMVAFRPPAPGVVQAQPEPAHYSVVINEVLADPAPGLDGDANGDGVRDTYEDEFIELVNRGSEPVMIGGWRIETGSGTPFLFPAGTWIPPGGYLTVFGGGTPTGLPGPTLVSTGRIGSGIPNAGGRILLINPAGPDTIQDITYSGWGVGASFTRVPEGWGPMVDHRTVDGRRFSPAGPALPGGGPDQSLPTIYRPRVVNLTSAGFQVAWRTGTPSDGRLEVVVEDAPVRHLYDPGPVGHLHLAGLYGLEPNRAVLWRVVSGGTLEPGDGQMIMQPTASASAGVPYTLHGETRRGVDGATVAGAHVYLRARGGGLESGWLAAVSDTSGRWILNLGNLRQPSGALFPWAAGDSLFWEADAGLEGIAHLPGVVEGISPQQVLLPDLEPSPLPQFEWLEVPLTATADSFLVLDYRLIGPEQSRVRLLARDPVTGEQHPAVTTPPIGPVTPAGRITLHTLDLAEGSRWEIIAVVEDGLNAPQLIPWPVEVRVAHGLERILSWPAGVVLFTPTLADSTLERAWGWLDQLPGGGELARWDGATGSWIATARTGGGEWVGTDFALQPGRGYALVSPVGAQVRMRGTRRYAPDPVTGVSGLMLVGVADSLNVRSATAVLAEPAVRAVSRWDPYRQAWQARLRVADGVEAGEDFLISWGEAVALEIEGALAWEAEAPDGHQGRWQAIENRSTGWSAGTGPGALPAGSRLLARPGGPGAIELLWSAPIAGADLRLLAEDGRAVWSGTASGFGWQRQRVIGLPAGRYRFEMSAAEPSGTRQWVRQVSVAGIAVPPLPRWVWGRGVPGEGPLLLAGPGGWIEAQEGAEGLWHAPGEQVLTEVVRLDRQGGFRRWSIELVAAERGGPSEVRLVGLEEAFSGLEASLQGPLGATLRFQVLSGPQPLEYQAYLGYEGPASAGEGPPEDPRRWVAITETMTWSPGDPPARALPVDLPPGPSGQHAPGAVAVRVRLADGRIYWLGPEGLPAGGEQPQGLALLPAVPNPFNPETMIRFHLPPGEPRSVRIEVLDVRGRRVRHLLDESRGPGTHQVRWDGRTEQGRPAPAGIYLVLLETEGRRLTRKILLLK